MKITIKKKHLNKEVAFQRSMTCPTAQALKDLGWDGRWMVGCHYASFYPNNHSKGRVFATSRPLCKVIIDFDYLKKPFKLGTYILKEVTK